MQYKTFTLQILRQRPMLHGYLRNNRLLLPTMEALAVELKNYHERFKDQIAQKKPGSDPIQIASEALELAIQELESDLPNESLTEGDGPISLEGIMSRLLAHTPPA